MKYKIFLLTHFGNENTRNCIKILSSFDTFFEWIPLNLHKIVANVLMLKEVAHFIVNFTQQDYLVNSNLYL